jgi:hypothetical protein
MVEKLCENSKPNACQRAWADKNKKEEEQGAEKKNKRQRRHTCQQPATWW